MCVLLKCIISAISTLYKSILKCTSFSQGNTKEMQEILSLFLLHVTKQKEVKISHPLLALKIFSLARMTGNEAKDFASMREERSQCEY